MLVPLEGTLPGWPPAPAPNMLWMFMLAIGIPVGIGLVVTFLCFGTELVKSARDNGLGSDDRAVESGQDDRRALESASKE